MVAIRELKPEPRLTVADYRALLARAGFGRRFCTSDEIVVAREHHCECGNVGASAYALERSEPWERVLLFECSGCRKVVSV